MSVDVSIVIDCYDQGHFLPAAIDSALAQTGPVREVVVVDDGSRDHSREVIARYRDAVVPVLKPNGGQASALNAGFARSRGDVVLFLDADDVLLPGAAQRALACFDARGVVKAHWAMWVIDADGRRTGQLHPSAPLPQGDRREALLRTGPTSELAPPTSGNAFAREFLEHVLPIPEAVYPISADKHLLELAPFFGELRRCEEPLSLYRRHAGASQLSRGLEQRLALELRFYDCYCDAIERQLEREGIRVDRAAWRRASWWHRQAEAVRDIASLPGGPAPLVLVDGGSWGASELAGRACRPFLEREGLYWGSPPDAATAIAELERMRAEGAGTLVFVWSTFWWLEHYAGLDEHLRRRFPCVLCNDRVIAFDLTRGEDALHG